MKRLTVKDASYVYAVRCSTGGHSKGAVSSERVRNLFKIHLSGICYISFAALHSQGSRKNRTTSAVKLLL